MERINMKLKRLTALILTVAMVVSSNAFSSVNYVFAGEQESTAQVQSETGAPIESETPVETVEESTVIPETETPSESVTVTETTGSFETTESTATTPETSESEEESVIETESETTGETETTETEPETESVPAVQSAPAAAAPQQKDGNAQFDFSAKVSESSILSGADFNYTIEYTALPTASGGAYQSASFTLTLPEHVKFRTTPEGKPSYEGSEVQSINALPQSDGTTYVTINLNPSGLGTGGASSIVLNLTTDNFDIPNGTEIRLAPTFSAATASSGQVTGSLTPDQIEAAKVTVRTEDDWTVKKSVVGDPEIVTESGTEYYEVEYQIIAQNLWNGTDSQGNHNGRLAIESYALTDIMPTGYPEGGGVSQVVSVTMAGKALSEGADYTVTAASDGSVEKIVINTHSVSESDLDMIDAGDPVTTTYNVTVRYPRKPYETASNVPGDPTKYPLTNTAQLDYKLLGEDAKTKTAKATIELGYKEKTDDDYSIVVQKMLKVGDDTYSIAGSGLEASFKLYGSDGKTLATSADGTETVGDEKKVDANGQVTFENLRHGTYYLEECGKPKGFEGVDRIRVDIDSDGTYTVQEDPEDRNEVSYDTASNVITVVNTAESVGGVKFTKYAKDPGGHVAPFAGAEFTLTGADGKTHTATSGNDGTVYFKNVPAGDYTLKETKVPNDDYILSNVEAKVTVTADQIADLNNELGKLTGSDNGEGFLNVSPKGKFQIKKVDSETGATLEGAEFKVYGPYASETDIPAVPSDDDLVADYTLTTPYGGVAVSKALDAGWYVLEETKAPADHAITDTSRYTKVKVEANQLNATPIEIKNVPTVDVTFAKKGAVTQNGQTIVVEELFGVELEIYQNTTDTEPIATVTTKEDGTGLSTTDPIELLPGTYYYKEKVGPGGDYKTDTDMHEFEVTRGTSNQCVITVYNYSEKGRIQVKKVDAADHDALLSGAEFEIWACDASGNLTGAASVGTITTDSTGYGVSDLIPAGTYKLKEIAAPAGYGIPEGEDVWSRVITVSDSAQVLAEIENELLKQATIKKVDEDGQPLAGAEFAIYEGTTVQGTPLLTETTGADGVATFVGLKPGTTYTIVETKAPEGYTQAAYANADGKPIYRTFQVTTPAGDSKDVSVSAGSANNYKKVDISFAKYTNMDDPDGDTLLAGATFTLYRYDDSADGHIGMPVGTATSNAQGQVRFTGLDYKVWNGTAWTDAKYVLRETTVPEGHVAPPDMVITINKDGEIIIESDQSPLLGLINRADQGKLSVEKYAADENGMIDTNTAVKATYDIYKDNSDGNKEKVGTITTSGKKGEAVTTDWLDPGNYELVETSVEGNYTLSKTPVPFTITAGQTTLLTGDKALTNVAQGQVKLNKKASFKVQGKAGETVEYDLTGAVIRLYKKTTDDPAKDITDAAAFADELDMSATSSATSDWLDAGHYWIVETTFPDDYNGGTQAQKITVGGQTLTVIGSLTIAAGQTAESANGTQDILNYTNKGKLRINKMDWATKALLDGAQFETYIVDPNGDVTTPDDAKVRKVSISGSTDGGGQIMESGTDGEGSALSIDIEPGTYYIKEVSVDKLNDQYGPTWYPYNGEWFGPITVKEGTESAADFYNYKMTGPGTKTDEGGTTLAGAIFAAFEDNNDAGSFAAYLKSRNVAHQAADGTYPNKAAVKADLANPEFLAEHNIYEVSTESEGNGVFEFESLQPGKTYYIVEVIPPDGYALSETVYEQTVKDDGTGFTKVFTVVDYPLGRFTVKKITELNGTEYAVEGVSFSVYEAVEDKNGTYISGENKKYSKADAVASGTSGANGLYTTVLLPEGYYIVEEDKLPENSPVTFPEDTTKRYKVVYIKSGDDGETPVHTFNNPAAYGKFIFKKVDQNDDLITDATITFQLYKKNGEKWDAVGESITAPKTGQYESGFLPAGEYKLVETAAPGYTIKYTEEKPLHFTIEGGKITGSTAGSDTPSTDAAIDQPMVLRNDKQGTLTLLKVGMFGNDVLDDNLQGVIFGLYTDKDCRQLVSEKTTDPTGKASWTNLDAGTYYLKELRIENGTEASGFQLTDTVVRKVEIKAGESVSLTTEDTRFENQSAKGKVTIKKIDANSNEGLSGAQFTIYQTVEGQKKEIAVITTGSDGTATSTLLPAGEYTIKETKAPNGYIASDEEKTFTITADTVTDLTNQPFKNDLAFSIQINKVNGKDQTSPVSGALIRLYDDKAKANADTVEDKGNHIAEDTTDSQGRVIFGNLTVGDTGSKTFYYKEVSVGGAYVLDTTVHSVTISYNDNHADPVIVAQKLVNDEKGKIQIKKVGDWTVGGTEDTVPLKDAVFAVYKADDMTTPVATLVTDDNGMATSGPLNAGDYVLKETKAPDGFALDDTAEYEVTVENNKTNTTYVDDPIENVADEGRFVLKKYDGSDQTDASNLTSLTGAVFELYRKDGNKWVPYNEEEPSFKVELAGGYTSGYLAPGDYMVKETQAPSHVVKVSGHEYTIQFELDETPIYFSIKAGVTGAVFADGNIGDIRVYNSPLGSIRLTKEGHDAKGASEVLEGASFQLYTDAAGKDPIEGSLKTTDEDGVCEWTNLAPGTYYIKEVETDAVKNAGYAISDEVKKVVIEEGQLVKDFEQDAQAFTEAVTMVNESATGRLRIKKTDEADQPLTGAVFEIYAHTKDGTGWEKEPIDTVTINRADGTLSDLLPADKNGTEYKVVEVQAPNGYTLDETLSTLEQIVTVYPVRTPAAADTNNVITFTNKKIDEIPGLLNKINKGVKEMGAADDETTDYTASVTASASLLEEDYHVQFKLDGYADGQNDVGAETFAITDNDLTLHYIDTSGSEKDVPLSEENGVCRDYTMTGVTILPAKNNKDASKKVGAVVYIQTSLADKASDNWTEHTKIDDVTSAATVSFAGSVVGVKVEYVNVDAAFTCDGLLVDVTFLNRGGWSTENDHEVRKITNTAHLDWEEKRLDEQGGLNGNKISVDSNPVEMLLPTYTAKLPQASITNEILNGDGNFHSGDTVQYKITVTNHDVEDQEENLRSPVVSFRMPAMTTVDMSKFTNGFQITKVTVDGTHEVLNANDYIMSTETTDAPLSYTGEDKYTDSETLDTTQYVFRFEGLELKEGEQLVIEFNGIISFDSKDANGVTTLVCPAYLGSTAKVPVSAENPLGTSFTSYDNRQDFFENTVANGEVGETLEYLNAVNQAPVTDSTVLRMVKYIGVENADGDVEYLNMGERAHVDPGENIYYKITVYNNSGDTIASANVIDVLPFNGDTYVAANGGAYTDRGTNIPQGPGYEDVSLIEVTASGDSQVYSTDYDFSSRSLTEENVGGVLGMMYNRSDSFEDNSNWSAGYSADSSAVGVHVDFGSEGLKPGQTYDIYITMKTPEYTADKIEDYYNKIIANSAMSVVTRFTNQDTPDTTETIGEVDRVEPNKVEATLDLPTGSLGDYAWYDENNNGLQDTDEQPAEGVDVTLVRTTHYIVGGRELTSVEETKSMTNQDGWYMFDNLACNYLKAGAAEGSTDPNDYVGGQYYTYQVRFGIPDGFSATDKEAGSDRAVDSNINPDGLTDPVMLTVYEGADGKLYGTSDMTIDAGFVSPYALGNYVWLDDNNDGLQGADEKGVEGVSVFLYRLDGPDDAIDAGDTYYARTTTDADGYYEFTNLLEGYYVVEFDISELRKDDGYTYAYDFTECVSEEGVRVDTDSDARYNVDDDGRIRRTEVIDLSEEALAADGIHNAVDPRWDAGLVVYSALGGFIFEDMDYDDLQSLYIPLPGTTVELYEVRLDGTMMDTPVATAVVGADGTYYFDHLTFPGDSQTYKVHFVFPEGYTGVASNAGSDDTRDSDAIYEEGADRSEGYTETITLKKDTVDTTWDAGARKYSAIGDYVWFDEDKDGSQNEKGTGIAGVRVILQKRENASALWEYYAETVTDDEGFYIFEDLESSDYIDTEYRVVFSMDPMTQITTCEAEGVGDDQNSDAIATYQEGIIPAVSGTDVDGGFVTRPIKPAYASEDLTWDAGIIVELSAVGDYVWYDNDYNGIQDPGEEPVFGVPVVLEKNIKEDPDDATGWVIVGETATDENGLYLFDNLIAGYYRVRFQVPDGYTATRYDQSADTAVDSDAVIQSESRWFYSRSFYLESGVTDLTWDAGIYRPRHRVETEIIHRVERPTVTRTVRRVRTVQTGDPTRLPLTFALLFTSAGAITWMTYRRRKAAKR